MNPIKRLTATLASSAVIVLTTAATAHAAPAGPVNNGLSFLRESAEALITFVKQVLA
ncbi:hypothetical protein [Streptomyces vietnamensis]|uniref:hypothetical protein n=1 Tax=Streptomyces vietnamensis TaxID=362257 RepID=UPI000AA11FCA|nr:hypothetical protein [Streptomyces vietnamensis]